MLLLHVAVESRQGSVLQRTDRPFILTQDRNQLGNIPVFDEFEDNHLALFFGKAL